MPEVKKNLHSQRSELEDLNSIRSVTMETIREKKRMINNVKEPPNHIGNKLI